MRLYYINYLLLYNKLFPNLLKQQIFIISVWGQEFEQSLAECFYFKISYQTAVEVMARAGVSSEGSTGRRLASKLTRVAIGRVWILTGYWAEGLSSSLAFGPWPPSVPCHEGFSTDQLKAWQLASLRPSESEGGYARWKPQSFCDLVSELVPHCFCLTHGVEANRQA